MTTVYPGSEKFFNDFITSLYHQTYRDFDLIILNDKNIDIRGLKDCGELNIVEIPFISKSPAKIREAGINYCFDNNYHALVFGDIDDYFENNRVEVSLKILNSYDIVVNDLTMFYDETGKSLSNYLSKRFSNMQEIMLSDVLYKNIFGLSNTAIKLRNLKKIEVDSSLVAIDWYIYSCYLINGASACFTNKTITYYRQHISNTIGKPELSGNYLLKGGDIKSYHYLKMSEIDPRFTELYIKNKEIVEQQKKTKDLSGLISDIRYNMNSNILWWEDVGITG